MATLHTAIHIITMIRFINREMHARKHAVVVLIIAMIAFLAGCGSDQGTELEISPMTSSAPTAEPTENPGLKYDGTVICGGSISIDDESIDIAGITSAEVSELIKMLPYMDSLRTIELGDEADNTITWEELYSLEQAAPDVVFNYSFSLYDKQFTLQSPEMDLSHIKMTDSGELVRRAVRCMQALEYLDMDSCNVGDEDMALIRDENPDTHVVWRVWFGEGYTCRTDTIKILASCPGAAGNLTVSNTKSLKYCTEVRYLDVGHNEVLHDISFVAYMPKLEVAILAMAYFTDTTPLANCTNLEYLEIQTNEITDLSPLSGLTKLKHLNIGHNFELADITPLYGLTQLERLWVGCLTKVPQEQIDEMQRRAPDCVINTTAYDPHDGWRYGQDRYELLIQQFGYDKGAYSYAWRDPRSYE